jgi:DNA mismatch repair protein MutL
MIRILPESLVNKIAAGEVIVRPASVVKELVENAVDAGASRILIDLANGCRDIRVRDNGSGIAREDLPRALLRHATSKIEKFEDLWKLQTRGFRGEALASIAAVSRLTILTRPKGEIAGARLESEAGHEPRIEAAGAPEGTDVWVRDLFYNTPARLKFLKSPASELQLIVYMVMRQAIIRPDIGFVLTHEKQTLLEVPAEQPWEERVVSILGTNMQGNLLNIDATRHTLRVRGFLVNPSITRKDRRYQFFYVNGRPVSSRSLSSVVQQAFKGLVMTQRFPVLLLDIIMEPGEVDVNVHPTKEEVRFRNEPMVLGVIHRVVEERLRQANLLANALGDTNKEGMEERRAVQGELIGPRQWQELTARWQTRMPGDFTEWTDRRIEVAPSRAAVDEVERVVNAQREFEELQRIASSSVAPGDLNSDDRNCQELYHDIETVPGTEGISSQPGEDAEKTSLTKSYPEPLGQIADCYIVARRGDDLLLIDQHAAHEKLLYLRLRQAVEQGAPLATQELLLPVTVDVPPEAVPVLQEWTRELESLGIRLQHFGGRTFVVQSVPADLPDMDVGGVIGDLVDEFTALGRPSEVDNLRERVIARMACRSAVKAGQALSLDEMRCLIRDVLSTTGVYTCPHGRPTMIVLTKDQLDRQFKRKL